MNAVSLGASVLRTTGVNYLEQAVSLDGKLLWYDGCAIWMSDVDSKVWRTLDVKSRACGELDGVIDVSWSSCSYLMAVVSERRLTVWRLTDDCKKFDKLMDEGNASGATRCLWHHTKPIVSFQSTKDLNLYEISLNGCSSVCQWKSRDLQMGVTCWMPDDAMVVTSKSSIHKLKINYKKNEIITHHVLTLKSEIRAIVVSNSADHIMVATDLRLDLSNAAKAEDIFESEQSCLFHFRRKQPLHGAAHVHVVSLCHDSTGTTTPLCSSCVAGIITPDLLCFNRQAGHLVVGSSTFRTLYVFVLRHSSHNYELELVSKVEMRITDRPKGICWNPTVGTLVLVGKLKQYPNSAFLTKSVVTEYELSIRCINTESQNEDTTGAAVETRSSENELTDLKMPDGRLLSEKGSTTRVSIHEVEDERSVSDVPDFNLSSERQLLVAILTEVRHIKQLLLLQSPENRETRETISLPSVAQMPVVYVTARHKSTRRKAFLLSGKRLNLATLQKSFGMEQIAMVVEGLPDVVLTADMNGFIPLEFEPHSEITIVEVTAD